VGLVAVTLLASACGGGGGPSGTPSPAAKATCTQKSVQIAVPVSPPNVVHIPPYVAKDLGYFKDENLDVEIKRFEGGVGAFRSVASGAVTLAGTSSEPAINAIGQGAEVKVVYTYAPNVDVSLVARPEIKTLADLKGKKIGIQEKGGFADVMSRFALQKAGIDPKDVSFVTTTTAGRVPQLVNGTVDTGILHIDQTLIAQKQLPGLHVLADMWEILTGYQYSVYVASSSTIKSDPATVECMVRALMKADRAIYDPAMKNKIIDIAAKYTTEDREIVIQTYDKLLKAKAWPQNEGFPKGNIEGVVKSLKDNGQLSKDLTFDDIVDLSFAKRVVLQLGKKDFPY
jgi:NitT/TauT family transport system substrate-binding protein